MSYCLQGTEKLHPTEAILPVVLAPPIKLNLNPLSRSPINYSLLILLYNNLTAKKNCTALSANGSFQRLRTYRIR